MCNSNREVPIKTPPSVVINSVPDTLIRRFGVRNRESERVSRFARTTDEDGIITTFELHLNNSRDEIKRPWIIPHLLSPTISSALAERKPGAFTCSSYRISGRNVTVSVFQRMQNEKGRFRHLLLWNSASVISPLTSRNSLEVRCSFGSYATIWACA